VNKSTTGIRRFVGLDVHADTIVAAIAEKQEAVRRMGIIPNREESIRQLVKRLNQGGAWTACYEAGPTGYTLYWQLTRLGIPCVVIAPTLVPTKAGDRVKTDRRDADRLAACFRAGQLTAVWVPDEEHEALRDLIRGREAAKQDQLRARHRLGKFLLRHGKRPPQTMRAWTQSYLAWIQREVKFDHRSLQVTLEDYLNEVEHAGVRIERLEKAIDEAVEQAPENMQELIQALQALRGIAKIGAVTIVAEVGTLSRFEHPSQLMGYSGVVSSEHSSGGKIRRGAITKTGNAHIRRVIVEAAWSQRYKPVLSLMMRKRQEGLSAEVQEIASKARHRLHLRYMRLLGKGKLKQQVVTAVAREMLGFIWAIGVSVERAQAAKAKGAA
jgi:transposase